MQLMRASVLLLALAADNAAEAPGEAPALPSDHQVRASELANSLATKLAVYNQTDGGGNPDINEDATVIEALIVSRHRIGERDHLEFEAITDVVSAASIKRNHNPAYRSLQSGASGTVRVGAKVGYTRDFDESALGGSVAFANEYAYQSLGFGVHGSWSFNEENTTVTAALQSYLDTVTMIRFDGTEDPEESRDTYTISSSWVQLLSPESLMVLDVGLTQQDGFLAGSFNSVFVSGVEQAEALPDSRTRYAATLRYKHALWESDAAEAGLRYYGDDWGISGITLDLRYFTYFDRKRWLLQPGYRLHIQTEADHYRERWSTAEEFMTSDPDLGDFTGHSVSLHLHLLDAPFYDGLPASWDIGATYATRDNGIDSFWIITGYRIHF